VQLSQSFGAAVDDVQNNKHFLKVKSESLLDQEKFIAMEMDKICVKRKINYKNGKLYRYSENSSDLQPARTCAVLILSAYGDFKEMVALKPVCILTSKNLRKIVRESADLIRECGFKVVITVTDNNAVNAKLFNMLCGKEQYVCIKEMYSGIKTFCTHNSVHDGKCIVYKIIG
jgi:hypothetical protein